MTDTNPKSTAQIAGHPIHPMLIPFPIAFFVSTFVADLVFLRTGSNGWATAATYLLAAGLVMAALAAVAGVIDFFGDNRIRKLGDAWMHMVGNVIAVLLEAVNLYLRYKGGPDAVAPAGVVLSGVVVAILLFTGWKGWEMVYRHRVGISS